MFVRHALASPQPRPDGRTSEVGTGGPRTVGAGPEPASYAGPRRTSTRAVISRRSSDSGIRMAHLVGRAILISPRATS